jgi:rhodanese-related sulfurtransferase
MKFKVMLIPIFLVTVIMYVMGNSSPSENSDYTSFDGLYTLISEKNSEYILLDVRTNGEYTGAHIPTAVNIPYDVISSSFTDAEKDDLIIVYCRSGNRSSIAKKTLVNLGYTNVHDFGAISRWDGSFVRGIDPGSL